MRVSTKHFCGPHESILHLGAGTVVARASLIYPNIVDYITLDEAETVPMEDVSLFLDHKNQEIYHWYVSDGTITVCTVFRSDLHIRIIHPLI